LFLAVVQPLCGFADAGLYWSTYQATVRREGVYNSASAGAVDFNQELCDPMEKEFSTHWQRTMDASLRTFLTECERKILEISSSFNQSLAAILGQGGLEAARLANMTSTASRSCTTALKASFQQMGSLALETQRELNRCLLPSIKEKMQTGYDAATHVPRGCGVFSRMKEAVQFNSQKVVTSMFDESMNKLLRGINDLIKRLTAMISSTWEIISKNMQSVFSICWDDQSDKKTFVDPAVQKRIRECRDALLPELNRLYEVQTYASGLLGIEREELELDVMGVESFEQSLERKRKEAEDNGAAFDLCDSDAELDVKPAAKASVKSEPRSTTSVTRAQTATERANQTIDLCDSDDEWAPPPPSGLRTSPSSAPRVKADPYLDGAL
jgi:hypothetical protein